LEHLAHNRESSLGASAPSRIYSDGELPELTRNFDWSRTPLGPIGGWSDLLVSMVNTVLSNGHPMLLWWGPDLIQFYNDAFRRSLGQDKHPRGLGQPARECWSEVWPVVGDELEAVMSEGRSVWHQDRLVPINRDGQLRDAYWTYSYSPVRAADGSVPGILITCIETTDRVITDQRLRTSENRLRMAQSTARLATWDWDLETGDITWDPASAWVYGRPPESMTSIDSCVAAIVAQDRDMTTRALWNAIEDHREYNHEFRVLWPDGTVHWLAGRGVVAYSREGRPLRVLGVNWDQTARKHAELALAAERRRLEELFHQAPAFVAVLRGPQHVFELVNPLYQELIGQRHLIGKSVVEGVPEAEGQGVVEILDRVYQTGEPFVAHGFSMMLARNENEPAEQRLLDFVYQPIREAEGNVSGIIALGVDVTDRRKAEQALRQTEKLAAVGRLASSIAHEINNPLEAVTNLLYLAQCMTDSPDVSHYLETAQQELARVANIATQTLRFHRQSTEARQTSLRDVLESVLLLFGRRFANTDIKAERQYLTEQQIVGYEGDLRQVFANFVSNALDASYAGGRLVVRVTDGIEWRSGRRGVRVTVADNGHGMSPETQRHIFEPFFTTKGITGTGLGLWISHEILQNHRAVTRVRSSMNPKRHGTVFSVWLPLSRE
jgi:PAS domain S-box-containing protein